MVLMLLAKEKIVLGVAVVPLQRDFDLDAVALAGEVDHLRVERRLGAVEVLDELVDAALVEELVLLLRRAGRR